MKNTRAVLNQILKNDHIWYMVYDPESELYMGLGNKLGSMDDAYQYDHVPHLIDDLKKNASELTFRAYTAIIVPTLGDDDADPMWYLAWPVKEELENE